MTFVYAPDSDDSATGRDFALGMVVDVTGGKKCAKEAATDLASSITSSAAHCTPEEFNSLVYGAVNLLLELIYPGSKNDKR